MNRFASRKFLIAAAALAANVWLVAEGAITDEVYRTIVIATVGAYVAGNVAQKATQKPPPAEV